MARAKINRPVRDQTGAARAGINVHIQHLGDLSDATIYTGLTGGGTLSTAGLITTDANGNIPGYLERDKYRITLSGTGFGTTSYDYDLTPADPIQTSDLGFDVATQIELNTEITNRQAAVSSEITNRQAADNALDARLDTLELIRTVWGRVSDTGTILNGSGFTCSRIGTGAYVVTFGSNFPSTPATTVTGWGFAGLVVSVSSNPPSVGGFQVAVQNVDGAPSDAGFMFHSIGSS